MSYRSIYIKRANVIRLKDSSLVVERDNEEPVKISLEDISLILLEDRKTQVSSYLLGELGKHYIGMIFVDSYYQPSSICLPLAMHYKQLKVFKLQMEVKKPTYSQCWKRIVEQKIINQLFVLEHTTKNEYVMDKLKEYSQNVQSGDKTNAEATAARMYFKSIFGEMFNRDRDSLDPINIALNYGYTIISANVCRLLACYGFNTMLGIHHDSYVNNFNLAYDIVEPFRQVVDMIVYKNLDSLESPLTTSNKQLLIASLHEKLSIDGMTYKLENAQEQTILSLINVISENDSNLLKLPVMIDGIDDENEQL